MALSLKRGVKHLLLQPQWRRLFPFRNSSPSFAEISPAYSLSSLQRHHSPSPASRFLQSGIRFFSSDQERTGAKVVDRHSEGEEEVDGDESLTDEEEEDDDKDLHSLSEAQTPLPDFKDPVEEAAYIGYRVAGRIEPGDISHFKLPKAFAVVQVGSHQFKISPGDCIYTEKLKFADINDKLVLERVLLLGSKTQTIIGRPYVPKAFVSAAVEEQVLDAKVIIFKKKRRKNYRRTRGHRQELTRLRILDIRGLGERRSAIA